MYKKSLKKFSQENFHTLGYPYGRIDALRVILSAMKRPKTGSTPKQVAYATRMLSGDADSKKEAALLSGFSMSVAENAAAKIEKTEGYHNAMIGLATKSNNLMLAALHEFEARGLKGFTNSELIKALNAIGSAWERVEKQRAPNKLKTPEGNRLHGILTRRTTVETAVLTAPPTEDAATPDARNVTDAEFTETTPDDDLNDF